MNRLDLFRLFETEREARAYFDHVSHNADLLELKDGRWIVLYSIDVD